MNVLIIGSGGREHALGWKLKQSKNCGKVLFCPGNAGTAQIGVNHNVSLDPVSQKTVDQIMALCRSNKVGLVVIGPEDPLAQGLTDRLTKEGLKVFGPSQQAAMLEADKAYAKHICHNASVPTAEARTFEDSQAALRYVQNHETPVVVKAAGLAKGKGVVVCDNAEQAEQAVRSIMMDREHGEAGSKIVVEERLTGQEVSILALVDGKNLYVLDPSQDHKQVGEGDTGPNTGGMGAYCPTPLVDEEMMARIERHILVPTIDAMRREDVEFKGVLYAGLMLTPGGPKVLEYNCRFGDPECQPLLVRLKGDLLEAMLAVVDGKLDRVDLNWDQRVACCVVICSGGYPGAYHNGKKITGLEDAAAMDDVFVFHAGTARDADGDVVNAGGRVINVVALADTLPEAREKANAAAEKIHWQGAFFRHDIGDRILTA